MVRARHHFPAGFYWGTATSAHQVEGGNTTNDWQAWEDQAGNILQGHKTGRACEWWAGRWREDLDLAAEAGQNSHRMSIEWSRVEPTPAFWDDTALSTYAEIISGMVERGMVPMVTLHHFTNPAWIMERGGWLNPGIVAWFERYTRKVLGALKGQVRYWVTINEPNAYVYSAYMSRKFPPGHARLKEARLAAEHMIRAHAAAYHAIHELDPEAQVGIAHHYRGMRPASPKNPIHRMLTRLRRWSFNDAIPETIRGGRLRLLGRGRRIAVAKGTSDFFGLNYYTSELISLDLSRPSELFSRGQYPPDAMVSESGFIRNDPEGFWEALRWAKDFGLPVFITENGVDDSSGIIRPQYLAGHIHRLWRAVNFNWPIQGYYFWTLVDNFEWERGWTQRFGLWELDRETQVRTPRPSAEFYAAICRENALSTEMVAEYAPDVFEQMFPE